MAAFERPIDPIGNPHPDATFVGSPPIDTIAIKMPAGYNMMPPAEWQALRKEQRFTLIKDKRVAFLSNGISIPVRQALQWLADNVGGDD